MLEGETDSQLRAVEHLNQLKNNVNALKGIKQEGKMLTKSVESLKLKENKKKRKSINLNINFFKHRKGF